METNIQKWGNSLGVRLPQALAAKKAFKLGSRVLVSETDTGLAIEIVEQPKVTLDALLKAVTKNNTPSEISWNESVGKEVW